MKGVLMVCLGNICRSPLAEGILKHKLKENGIELEVDSAGTSAYHIGERPDLRAQKTASLHGINISGQRSRRFNMADFKRFNRIYAMDGTNYNELIRMAQTDEDRSKVEMIMNRVYPGQNLPVPDPYYGGNNGFDEVFQLLDAACEQIVKDYLPK